MMHACATPSTVRRRAPGGFTLVESLVATTIAAVAGSALLWGISSAMQNTNWSLEQTIGLGLAQQLMDEIAAKTYCATKNSPYDYPFAVTAMELIGPGRSKYTDIGAYNGLRSEPATDPWGKTLGTGDGQGGFRNLAAQPPGGYFSRWRQEVDVYYVSNADQSQKLPGTQTSDFRCVEVRILYHDPALGLRPITTLKRVFAYVSAP